MKAFRRVFRYIWPQWPRVLVVVFSAIIISILLSLSFMTIIPLLKVMIGSEGLHGWADRKACLYYYGLDFHVQKTMEMTGGQDPNWSRYLLVLNVEKNSPAATAGFKPGDMIVGFGSNQEYVPFTRLLEEFAISTEDELIVKIIRPSANKTIEELTLTLNTLHNQAYLSSLPWNAGDRTGWPLKVKFVMAFKRAGWEMKIKSVALLQRTVSVLPREQSPQNQVKTVVFLMVAIGLVTIVRCTAKFCQDYLAEKIVQVGVNRLREDVFAHLTFMPVGFFANERPSDTVSRIVSDAAMMGQALKVMLGKALREPMNAFFMLAAGMLLNWKLTLIFLCGAPFVMLVFITLGKKMRKATKKSLVASSQMLAKLQETASGLRIVKVYNQQQHEQQVFKRINKTLLTQHLRISKVDSITHPLLEILGMIAASAAIVVGVRWVVNGNIDGPEFLTLLVLLGVSADSVRKTSDVWNKLQQANAAAERVFAVLDRPIEVEMPNVIELPPIKGEVEFRDVFFTYPGATTPTLKGINLIVCAGHNIAIVGPNGSGKTTLANLIPRFYDPDSGRVLIDQYDICDVTRASLRDQIGMVTQDMVTFHDTIAANIAYGKSGANMDEVVDAAKRAFAHEFISRLADGYDMVIGEHNTGLSGGQLQRIAIARAILKNPPILIFDEATSQVDADSEAKIHSAIEEIMHDRTTFIIAHRFSTVVAADVIVVMDQGRIVAQGRHEELIQTCLLYQSLYETQLVRA